MSEEDKPIYAEVSVTDECMVNIEIRFQSNHEKIFGFAWPVEYAENLRDGIHQKVMEARERLQWRKNQAQDAEDAFINWLEDEWKGESG